MVDRFTPCCFMAERNTRYAVLFLIMLVRICRPFITLRNGKRLYAWEKGLKAFCFDVNDIKAKEPSNDDSSVKTV